MKKIGFIDIQSSNVPYLPETIHIFSETGEYEKTIAYSNRVEGIGTFYASIPLAVLNFRFIDLPFSDKEKLKQVIPMELDNLILDGSQNVTFDTVIMEDSANGGVKVLVAYAKNDTLQQILRGLAADNIDVSVITSIDLRAALSDGHTFQESAFSEAIVRQLIQQEEPGEVDRLALARQEIIKATINLRTGTFADTSGAEKIRKSMKYTAWLAGLIALVVYANIVVHAIAVNRENASLRREIHQMYAGIFPNEKNIADELYQMRSHLKEVQARSDALIGISPLSFLLDLSKRMDPGIVYYDIQLEKGLIKMKGEAPKMDVLSALKAKLSEFLYDVSISDVSTAASGGVIFTVVAKEKA